MGRVVVVAILAAQATAGAVGASSGSAEWESTPEGEVAGKCASECGGAWSNDVVSLDCGLALFQTKGTKVIDPTAEHSRIGRGPQSRASADADLSPATIALAQANPSSDNSEPPRSLARQLPLAIAVLAFLLVLSLVLRACTDRVLNRTLTASSKFGSLTRLKATVLVAALCHFCMSYNAGTIAGAWLYMEGSPKLSHIDSVTRYLLFGATVGSLGSSTADVVGRKNALLSVAALYVAGAVMMGVAPRGASLVVGRSIAGLGVGMSSVAVSVYISEISPADCRGQLNSWAVILGTLGILVSQVAALVLGSAFPASAFGLQLGLVAVPALVVIFSHGLLVESPRWLLLKGRRGEANVALATLFPTATPDIVAAEIQTLENDIKVTTATYHPTFADLRHRHGWRVTLGVGINILQQLTGVNVVIYASPMILEGLGLRDQDALLALIFISLVQLCTLTLSTTLVDRIGRRTVAICGMLGIICSHFMMVVAFAAKSAGRDGWQVLTAALGMLLFRAAFSFSLDPIPYIMTAELFPAEFRATGAAFSLAANWCMSLLVCWSFPLVESGLASIIAEDIGISLIFAFYMSFCIIALLVVHHKLPETAARQLEWAVEEPSPSPHTSR